DYYCAIGHSSGDFIF
nr:immunoglobulin light chain junction region [Macaca mulatta]